MNEADIFTGTEAVADEATKRRFEHRVVVDAPLQEVYDFHHSPKALKQLSPPLMGIRFHKLEPLAEGSLADFTMQLGPLPIRWVARHQDISPYGFTDVQMTGPFKVWQHTHHFRLIDANRTEVIDEIEAVTNGLLSKLMWFGLPILFKYRGRRLQRLLQR